MADDVISYDTAIGVETVAAFDPTVRKIFSDAVVDSRYSRFGTDGGPSFDRMVASFTTFEETVNTRITEHKRIGEIIGTMLAGVHVSKPLMPSSNLVTVRVPPTLDNSLP